MNDIELYRLAEEARKNAYAPFSGFRVGAALLTKAGRVYTGVNVENSSYGATICAERTAFVKAISEGERDFDSIAISAGSVPSLPCGICRQFMYEFAPDIRVITGPLDKTGDGSVSHKTGDGSVSHETNMTGDGGLSVKTLRELLPDGFVLERE